MIAGILIFVAGIFVMILVHELGHYVAAKRFGIKVDEFFIGFGPRLWSFRRGETEYGLKALPLGGYVRIAGMNPFEEEAPEDRPRLFTSKPKRQRAVVLAAGGLTHFVLAFLLLLTFFWFVGRPIFGGAEIVGVQPTLEGRPSPAAVAGLQAGDRVVSVDGRPVRTFQEVIDAIDRGPGDELDIVVEREGEEVALTATPVSAGEDGSGRLGIVIGEALLRRERSGVIEGVADAGVGMGRMALGSFQAMGAIFSPEGIGRVADALFGGRERTPNDPVGVVGAARVSGQALEAGEVDVLFGLFAFFNVFVGILNLLPLPPLDGGHLAVLGVEAATGRRVDQRKLIPITAVVAGFLILFTVSLLYLDVVAPIPNPFE